MSNSQEAPVGLYTKLLEVARSVAFVEKTGRNDHHHYNYVQAVDVTRTLRDELLGRAIIVLPGASHVSHLPYGTKGGHLTTVDLAYRFIDSETGEVIEIPWVGAGVDIAGDKGLYKAFTGGLKYMLMTAFLIPSSDDPERDQLTQQEDQERVRTATPASSTHKDDARPAAPTIPRDRATAILQKALHVGMATIDMDGAPGDPPSFHPAFKAVLALQDVTKIGQLNVDQAEQVEAWLAAEAPAETTTEEPAA